MGDNDQNCSNCGTALSPGDEFCGACGTPTVGGGGGGGGGMDKQKLLYIGGGVAAALALVGGAYFFMSGAGAGGADRNGDGVVSLEEFRVELMELKKPKPGRWKIEWRGGAPESGSDENFFTFSTEVEACDRRAWDDVDEFFKAIRDPDTFAELDEGLKEFQKEANGQFKVDRFDIDGDNFELALSASGDFDERGNKVSGSGDFAVSGIFAEDRVQLEGPVNFALKMAISEDRGMPNVNFDSRAKGGYSLHAERIGDCPAGSMSRSDEDEYDYAAEAAAEDAMAPEDFPEYGEAYDAAEAAEAMASEF